MTFLRPERGARPGGQNAQIARLSEEVRLLRQNTGASPVQPWQPLYPYLKPWWQALVNDDSSDLTDPAAPRFYLDRDRVYLGGVIKFDATVTLPGGEEGGTIIQDAGFPAECIPARQQDVFLAEDRFWSDVASQGTTVARTPGWDRRQGVFGTGSPMYFYINSGGSDLPPQDGLAICLDTLSYRVAA